VKAGPSPAQARENSDAMSEIMCHSEITAPMPSGRIDNTPSDLTSDVVIIGGGLAGSAAAIMLARAGRHVILLEKESQPQHKVCGEFLSQEALTYLRALGVDVASLGAVPIERVRFAGNRNATSAPLPFAVMSLTRRRLDEDLLRLAAEAGATVLRGCPAQSLRPHGDRWQVLLQTPQSQPRTITAPTAFLATGKHDLRGRPRPEGRQRGLVAFKMYWQLAPEQAAALAGHVELVLYRGGYAGLQPVEDGAANLCCLIQRSELQRLSANTTDSGHWENLLAAMQRACPHLRQRLHGAQPLLARPLAASAIPYGYVRESSDGVWSLGDQASVIPSFTGDGMSIALHSGCLAAAMVLRGETAASFQHRLRAQVANQVSLATILSRGLVAAPLQSLFAAAVSLWPGILGHVAAHTRIPASAMLASPILSPWQGETAR
jgi:flavin-dependent dehydrogenase